MKADNTALWDLVCTTDPKSTRDTNIGGRKITAIDAQVQRKKATEVFGPYGIGWGIITDSEKYEYRDIEKTTIVSYFSVMFYHFEGKEGRLPINAAVKFCYMTKGNKPYLVVDDEYTKKVQTNALTKGLSTLGFNSDVFERKFDDCKYYQQAQKEFTSPLEWVGSRPKIKTMCSNLKLTIKEIDEAVKDNEFSDVKVMSYLNQLADAREDKK